MIRSQRRENVKPEPLDPAAPVVRHSRRETHRGRSQIGTIHRLFRGVGYQGQRTVTASQISNSIDPQRQG